MQDFDFDNALAMHRAWKMKFHLELGRVQGEEVDTRALGDATQCDLGRWLAANAAELEASRAAAELMPAHGEFHRQSRAIADAVRHGRILNMDDPAIAAYLELSARVETLLLRLRREVGAGA